MLAVDQRTMSLERESTKAADDGLSVAVLVAWCFERVSCTPYIDVLGNSM
jgi:hypothetical protein